MSRSGGLSPAVVPSGRKAEVVWVTHRLLQAGLLVLAPAVVGVLLLVVDQTAGQLPRLLVSSLVRLVYALLWFVLPAWSRGSPQRAASATAHPHRDQQV
ncbi:MAG: DUF6328 family protein [Pseudonocardiaceae bacterium]